MSDYNHIFIINTDILFQGKKVLVPNMSETNKIYIST